MLTKLCVYSLVLQDSAILDQACAACRMLCAAVQFKWQWSQHDIPFLDTLYSPNRYARQWSSLISCEIEGSRSSCRPAGSICCHNTGCDGVAVKDCLILEYSKAIIMTHDHQDTESHCETGSLEHCTYHGHVEALSWPGCG